MASMGERPVAVKGGRPAGLPSEATGSAAASALPHHPVQVHTARGRQAAPPTRSRTQPWRDGVRLLPPLPRSLLLLVQHQDTQATPWTPQERAMGRTRTMLPCAPLIAARITAARFQFPGQPSGLRPRRRPPSPVGGRMPVTERLRSSVPGPAAGHAWRCMVRQTRPLFHGKQRTPAVALRSMGRSGR